MTTQRAYIYSRANDERVLKAHTAALVKLAKEKKLENGGIFIEERSKRSGYPAFEQLLAELGKHPGSCVLIHDVERLPRTAMDLRSRLFELAETGQVEVLFLRESQRPEMFPPPAMRGGLAI